MSQLEVVQPPEDSVSCLKFSPECIPQTFLIGSSWANDIRCWQIDESGKGSLRSDRAHSLRPERAHSSTAQKTSTSQLQLKLRQVEFIYFLFIFAKDQSAQLTDQLEDSPFHVAQKGPQRRPQERKSLQLTLISNITINTNNLILNKLMLFL